MMLMKTNNNTCNYWANCQVY